MDQRAFIRDLIGRPWERGATGPDAWDCGSLTAHVQRQLFGRTLPVTMADYAGLTSAEALRQALLDVDIATVWPARPKGEKWAHGDVIVLRRGAFCHVGTWLKIARPGRLLHAARHEGVRLQDRVSLLAQGWSSVEACRPGGAA